MEVFRLARKRPRAWATTYDLPGRRGPKAPRLALVILAAILAAGLTFGGLALMSRSAAAPVTAAPEPPTSGAPASLPPPTGEPASTPAPSGPASTPPSSTPPSDAALIQTATKFTDSWLQRDRATRRAGLTATATPELAQALMLTDDANIPRTRRQGGPSIDTRLSDTVLVLQRLADKTELKVTLTAASGRWLVTAIDMDAD